MKIKLEWATETEETTWDIDLDEIDEEIEGFKEAARILSEGFCPDCEHPLAQGKDDYALCQICQIEVKLSLEDNQITITWRELPGVQYLWRQI